MDRMMAEKRIDHGLMSAMRSWGHIQQGQKEKLKKKGKLNGQIEAERRIEYGLLSAVYN